MCSSLFSHKLSPSAYTGKESRSRHGDIHIPPFLLLPAGYCKDTHHCQTTSFEYLMLPERVTLRLKLHHYKWPEEKVVRRAATQLSTEVPRRIHPTSVSPPEPGLLSLNRKLAVRSCSWD